MVGRKIMIKRFSQVFMLETFLALYGKKSKRDTKKNNKKITHTANKWPDFWHTLSKNTSCNGLDAIPGKIIKISFLQVLIHEL